MALLQPIAEKPQAFCGLGVTLAMAHRDADTLDLLLRTALQGNEDSIRELYALASQTLREKSPDNRDDQIASAAIAVLRQTDARWLADNPGIRPHRFKADILDLIGHSTDARTVQRFLNDETKMAQVWAVAELFAES